MITVPKGAPGTPMSLEASRGVALEDSTGKLYSRVLRSAAVPLLRSTAAHLQFGALLWERKFDSSFPVESTPMVSRAAPTPVGDKNGIFVFFESGDLVAYDLTGTLKWQRSLQKDMEKFENKFGLSSTPAQTAKSLFVLLDHAGESSLVCIDKQTGNSEWNAARGVHREWFVSTVNRSSYALPRVASMLTARTTANCFAPIPKWVAIALQLHMT